MIPLIEEWRYLMGNEELREIKDIAENYRKDNRDYKNTCDDNKTLRILLGCQEIEMRNMRIELQKFINTRPEPKKEKPEGDLVEGLSKFIHKFKEHLDLGQSCRECRHEAQAIADYIKEER